MALVLSTLKTDILANTNTIPAGQSWSGVFAGMQVKDVPNNGDGNAAVAGWYGLTASPDYFVWRTDVPINEVFDQITWANYTPLDTPDNTVTYQNRAMLCQTKQINLQLMLQGRDSLDAGKKNIRAGLNDATTNLPSGAAGASRSGGWAAILPVLYRKARNIEKLLAVDDGAGIGNNTSDPRGASTNPDALGFEGTISATDVGSALNS